MLIGSHDRTGISTFAFKLLQRLPQKGIRLLAYYRFFQIADYICGIELTATKYERETSTKTDKAFFGDSANFKKNYLKKIRRKRLG